MTLLIRLSRHEGNSLAMFEQMKVHCTTNEGGCLLWTGALKRDGYPRVWYDGRASLAHRVAHKLVRGDIAPGLQLDHLCRNRACINPHHLEPVTNAQNQRRKLPRELGGSFRCGHVRTAENSYVLTNGKGYCRTCQLRRRAEWRASRRRAIERTYRPATRPGSCEKCGRAFNNVSPQ